MNTPAKSYLTINNLTVNYGKGDVVNDLSCNLDQGDIGCLLGESGCGKTTALRALAGLEALKSGDISLDGNSLTNTPAAKRGIGMVFQDYALFTHLTVAENVGFGLGKTSGADKNKRVADMLELVGLTGYENSLPEQLSGGQQQRVALARALAPAPKLLLLDEPFSNLDINLRENLATSVRDILKATNTTAILVTHDQFEAFAMADKVGVMQQGKLAQWGTPEDLYHEPATPEIAEFIGEGVMLNGVVSSDSVLTNLGELSLNQLASQQVDAHHHTHVGDAVPRFTGGEQVKVLVRPDDIIHDDTSHHKAKVVKRVFRGANYLYTLELDSGETLLSLIPSHHDHAIGERIGIVPMLDHVVAFSV